MRIVILSRESDEVTGLNMVNRIREAGVVGAGGAGFPTHVKLDAQAKWLILNAAECEPLLRVDQQLCEERAQELVRLMAQVAKHLRAEKAVIGIKKKHGAALEKLTRYCNSKNSVQVFPLEDFYPAGDEQVLVAEITGFAVPELAIPLKVGCVVLNVETLLNIGEALAGNPVTRTCLTVAGEVPHPKTLWLPLGISYKEALSAAGVETVTGMVVIDGGPMMGRVIRDFSEPITKTTKGILLLNQEHRLVQRKTLSADQARRAARTACEQCRMCTDLCPRYLIGHNMQPHKMMRKVGYTYERLEDAAIAQLCCECNLCELYACPVGLSPKTINVMYKGKLATEGIRHVPNPQPEFRSVREYRKTPVKRLIQRLGLSALDQPAPMEESSYQPEKVRVLLKQHAGAPALPVVSVGEAVVVGQLIGEIPPNALGARIHASITGVVSAVDQNSIHIHGNRGGAC